jgi:hypothetical protein
MKKVMLIIITMLLAVSLASCVPDSLGDYKKAAEKTDQIKKGQTAGEFSVEMDFNTEGMTEDQIKGLNYFKNMKGSFNVVFDDEAKKGIFRNYMSFGGLGFDYDMFMNGEEMFMKLPVIGKYMRIDDLQASIIEQQSDENVELISGETQDEISAKWLGLLKKECDIVLSYWIPYK